jgi:hypothetical protein
MTSPYRAPDEEESETPPPIRDERLGELRSTHAQGRGMRAAFIAATIVPGCAALFAFVTKRAAPFVLAIGVLLAVIPIWLFSELLVGLGSMLEVWDEGLVFRRRWTEPVEIRFDEIDSIFYDFEVSEHMGFRATPTAKVILTTHAGRRVVIPRGLAKANDVLLALDRKVVRPLLAPAGQALAAGEVLNFGPIVLDSRGVTIDGDPLAWDEIDKVEAEPDYITFHKKGSRWRVANVAVRTIPHPRIFVILLSSRVHVDAPSGFWAE